MEILSVMNILDVEMHVPGVTAVTDRRIEGSLDVYRPVSAVFCDKRVFAPFHAIKRRIDRCCLAVGTRLLGGYAVPDDALDGLLEQIKTEKEKFFREKEKLLGVWPAPVEDWIKAHPVEEPAIRAVAPVNGDIAKGLECEVSVFKVAAESAALEKAGIECGLQKQVSGISWGIASEIAAEARNAWKSRAEKAASNQEIRKSLNRWAEKLRVLSFLDPVFVDVERLIRNGIGNLPASGKIEGADFLALSGLMAILGNPEMLLRGGSADIGEAEVVVQPKSIIGW